ncbi:phosphatase PAP2 family protein [Natronomonas sp.]|uniref:phosphatase PAP2 family protein n=1 Tax=Natronomonas sp. TaxID=2184060 RepID=UPI003974EC07
MSRGLGEIEFVAGLPDPVVVATALVTALGDVWFVFLLLGTLYWFGTALPSPVSLSRRHAAFAIALAFGGLAATTALKETFRLPRPPGAAEPAGAGLIPELLLPLYAEIGASSGFGFPSGHAVSAVVVYGGLALLVGSTRGYAVGAVLCAVIPLSRIVLGVHYLVDVLAGVALGAAYLGLVYRLCGRGSNPGRAMMIALIVAVVGAGLSYTTDTMLALGGALGARMAWGSIGGAVVHEPVTRLGGALGAAVGLGFAGLFAVVYIVDPAPYLAFIGIFVVIWGVLAAPLAGESLARTI